MPSKTSLSGDNDAFCRSSDLSDAEAGKGFWGAVRGVRSVLGLVDGDSSFSSDYDYGNGASLQG